ncbi:Ntn hydrolase family protein [Bacillus wiedmannii]|uniref:hypothetical protein n=1 Tax=Bacillus wiedmannii TaxID=1890302 RepID=UPI0021D20855|nr:hypothetical protein [Bacillus wiedmannii]MCU5098199.1 hypothetical protein [Bacillus wiedmannii]
MTVIVGLRAEKNIAIVADQRRSNLDEKGRFKSVNSDSVKKIHILNDSFIIASGGIAAISDAAVMEIKTKVTNNMTKQDLIKVCQEAYLKNRKNTFKSLYSFFANFSPLKKAKRKEIYSFFLLAGIDGEGTFLYQFNSDDNFKHNGLNLDSLVKGYGELEIIKFIENKNQKPDLITCVANAIRTTSVREPMLSPNVYVVMVDSQGTKESFFDKNGKPK